MCTIAYLTGVVEEAMEEVETGATEMAEDQIEITMVEIVHARTDGMFFDCHVH